MNNLKRSIYAIALSLVLTCLAAPSLMFAASFIRLGDFPGGIYHSVATGVSADGSVVVGYAHPASNLTTAFRWDAANGMIGLGPNTGASGVSADGNVVVGNGLISTPHWEAFRWDATSGIVGLGSLVSTTPISDAFGTSANGDVVVGDSYSQSQGPGYEAFRWDATNGMVGLGDFLGGDLFSRATGVSTDGSVVVGYGTPESVSGQLREAFRWDVTNGMVGLGFLPGSYPNESQATGVSADGSVVVGNSGRYNIFRWDPVNGMVDPGQLPGGSTYISANAVSADGNVIVGGATTPSIARKAFRWDATNGMQIIADLLESAGVDLTGWQLLEATGVSADGSTIVGWGYNPDGDEEAWVAQLGDVTNSSPIANAGNDETVHLGAYVTLDGSASSDPEENYPLSYAWTIVSRPNGSTAILSDANSMNPSFSPDLSGDYLIELIVTDNLNASSTADQVLISTYNTTPVADAGPDQAIIHVGTQVLLNGSLSWDDDGDPIAFAWTIIDTPEGSTVQLSDPTSATPTFVPDVYGDYEIQLVVSDPWFSSEPDTVTIGFENIAPVADAGDNQSAVEGAVVYLNGDGSYDANMDQLTYRWSIISKPLNSTAEIADPISIQNSFIVDYPGEYVFSLVVNDGLLDSEPSNVTIAVISSGNTVIELLQDAIININDIADNVFNNPNNKKALTNKINAALMKIEEGLYSDALEQLSGNGLLGKVDGCSEIGVADKNDWIKNCESQSEIYQIIILCIELLQESI